MQIAISISILVIAAVFLITQLVKKEVKTTGEPAFIKEVKSIGAQVKPIGKDSWEAYYPEYGITMIYIPPGEFMMGQTEEEKKWLIDQVGEENYNSNYTDETPLHKVYLEGYWMGKYEVTFAQYDRYCNETKIEKGAMKAGAGKVARLSMYPGPKLRLTANGYPKKPAFDLNYQPKRSGKRLPAGTIGVNIPGEIPNLITTVNGMQIIVLMKVGKNEERMVLHIQPRWVHIALALLTTAFLIWPVMCGNGAAIGMELVITKIQR
jgi:hypothetical protein